MSRLDVTPLITSLKSNTDDIITVNSFKVVRIG